MMDHGLMGIDAARMECEEAGRPSRQKHAFHAALL